MSPDDDVLATVTHAKLRARQGDVRGARRMLETILSRRPGDPEATVLLGRLDEAEHVDAPEPPESTEPVPVPASADALAARFRHALAPSEGRRRAVSRLRAILERIDRSRGSEPCVGGGRE